MRWFAIAASICALFVGAVFVERHHSDFIRSFFTGDATNEQPTIYIDEIPVLVTVADTPEERTQGLSGRERLTGGEGMLFVFEEETIPGFWMKDMRFAIDIIWISARGEVVGIDEHSLPESYPAIFAPTEPVKFVLEVPAGFTGMNTIKIGSKINLEMVY